MTPEREKIAAKIRALRAKTVENGCTEAEALSAAEMLAKLLAQYNMTLDWLLASMRRCLAADADTLAI